MSRNWLTDDYKLIAEKEHETMSWKPEVQVKGEGARWHDNALRFSTESEAAAYAKDLCSRWTLATAHRAAPSEDPVTYAWIAGRAVHIADAIDHNND